MKTLISIALLATLSACAFAADAPRKSPDVAVSFVDGKQAKVGDYHGKVVAMIFVLTTCSHCQHTCEVLEGLQKELGAKGFQVLAAAINDNPNVTKFIADFHLSFPVGVAPQEKARDYMQLSPMVRTFMPYLTLVDRNGNIRGQYTGGDPIFVGDQAANLRPEILKLLNEPGANGVKHKK